MKKNFSRGNTTITISLTAPEKIQDGKNFRNRWGVLASSGVNTFACTYTGMALSVKGADVAKLSDVLYSLLSDAGCASGRDVDDFLQEFGYAEDGTVKRLREGEAAFAECTKALKFFEAAGLTVNNIYDWQEELDQ
jgi:hypothetical protein